MIACSISLQQNGPEYTVSTIGKSETISQPYSLATSHPFVLIRIPYADYVIKGYETIVTINTNANKYTYTMWEIWMEDVFAE